MSTGKVYSQDFIKDVKNAGELYQNTNNFAADLTVEVQYSENTPMQLQQIAKIRRKDNRFYYLMGGAVTVVTEQLLLMVNEGNKSIFFRELMPSEREAVTKKYYKVGIDSISSSYDSVAYSGIEKYGKHYIVYSATSKISKTDLYIDSSTGFINRIVYSYNKKMTKELYRLVITFAYPVFGLPDEKLIKQETYLVKTGTQYKPAQKYLNYELNKIDNE